MKKEVRDAASTKLEISAFTIEPTEWLGRQELTLFLAACLCPNGVLVESTGKLDIVATTSLEKEQSPVVINC